MKKYFILLSLISIVSSCKDEDAVDCSAVLCAGPATLVFEILQNGQNVFDNGTSIDDIGITGNFPETFEFEIQESNFNDNTKLFFVQQIA